MKVYIVISKAIYSTIIEVVFSSLAKAEDYVKEQESNPKNRVRYDIIEKRIME